MKQYEMFLNTALFDGKSEAEKRDYVKKFCLLLTHSSTAIEGSTLTLSQTEEVLFGSGLAVGGALLSDQQSALGHQKAFEYTLRNLYSETTEKFFFNLHNLVQTDLSSDIYAMKGGWKTADNGTTGQRDGKTLFIEYTKHQHVAKLMEIVIDFMNSEECRDIDDKNAHEIYSRVHTAISQIHPFYDGNGRMSRLIANIPLLRAGLSPIIIPNEWRQSYMEVLFEYSTETGPLEPSGGVWSNYELLYPFTDFCYKCSVKTKEMLK